jgi:hypothetical protein
MKGIRQRGERFIVDVCVKGVRRTATASTLDEAKATHAQLRANLLHDVGAESPAHKDAWTLQQAWQRTADVIWKGQPSAVPLTAMASRW